MLHIYAMTSKARRRQLLLDILSQQSLANQERLAHLLAQRGVEVTQATLSRDLRDLNVFKGPSGYVLGQNAPEAALHNQQLETSFKLFMINAQPAGSLVVMRTRPGHASPLASELDRVGMPGVVGTIAGDDTIFIATVSPARAKGLVRIARSLVGRT